MSNNVLSTVIPFLEIPNMVFLLVGNAVIIASAIVAFRVAKKRGEKGVEMWGNIILSINYACAIFSIIVTVLALFLFIFSGVHHIIIVPWLLAVWIISFMAAWIIFSLLLGFSAFLGHHFGVKKLIELKLMEQATINEVVNR